MVGSAPKSVKMGLWKTRITTVRITPTVIREAKLTPMISSAPLWSFFPILMAHKGAPPIPTNLVNAVIQVISGRDTLKAAMAVVPFSILPMNIRSTMLYKIPTSWAMMEGMESESISFHMFPVSSLLFPLFSVFPCCSISAASYLLLFVGPVHGEGLHIIIL